MTNQAILEKAIQKARKNGWRFGVKDYDNASPDDVLHSLRVVGLTDKLPREDWYTWGIVDDCAFQKLIFNHDFAKALWGEGYIIEQINRRDPKSFSIGQEIYVWQYHLQQMVIADDPIVYLGEHLD